MPQLWGLRILPACFTAAQFSPQLRPSQGHKNKTKQTDRQTVGQTGGQSDRESVTAGSHIAAFSLNQTLTGRGQGVGGGVEPGAEEEWRR